MNCGVEGVGGKEMERKKEKERDYVISSYNNIIFPDFIGLLFMIYKADFTSLFYSSCVSC